MKINTRKSVIFAALAVMIITTALVVGCMAQVDDGLSGWKDEPTAPGTGRVKLSINRHDSRTILPGSLGTLSYQVIFSGGNNGGGTYTTTTTSNTPTISGIPVDSYTDITVNAYPSSGAPGATTNVASGSISGTYGITDGGTLTPGTPVVLAFINPTSAAGNGNFTYNIGLGNFSDINITTATMTVVAKTNGDTVPGSPFNLLSAAVNTAGIAVKAGYYTLVIDLKDDNNDTTSLFQMLHIYQGLTSNFTYSSFDDELFPRPATPSVSGSIVLSFTDPLLPTDGTYNLVSEDAYSNIISSGGRKVFQVLNGETSIELSVTYTGGTPTVTAYDWTRGDGSTSLTPSTGVGKLTIDIDTTASPWKDTNAQVPTIVFFNGGIYNTVVYIQVVDSL